MSRPTPRATPPGIPAPVQPQRRRFLGALAGAMAGATLLPGMPRVARAAAILGDGPPIGVVVDEPAAGRLDGPVGAGDIEGGAAPDRAGHRLAGEFERVAALWLSYDQGHEAMTVGLVAALQAHVPLRFIVRGADDEAAVRALLRKHELAEPALGFVHEPLASYFVRDVAVFTRADDGASGVVDFAWTEYGMSTWCARRHAGDPDIADLCGGSADRSRDTLDRAIARHLDARLHRSALALEGGGLEVNGRGLVIANEALLRSRNPGRTRDELEAALLGLPGLRKVIWLPEGLAEDVHLRATITGDYVGWGTGGHTDEFVRFADASTVLLAWPDDADVAAHPVSRLTRTLMQRNAEILADSTDVDGSPLRVIKVPMPRPIERRVFLSAAADTAWSHEWTAEFFPAHERRWQGQALVQIATASYLNFVVANGVVVLPDYLPHGTPRARQNRVRRLFERAFPGRRIAFVDAIGANWVGGGLHCATLTQP